MTPGRRNRPKAKDKPKRKGTVQGNDAWKALSSKTPRGKPEPVKYRLTPLDVYGRKTL